MSVYKPKYRGGKILSKWYVSFKDHMKRRRRLPAFMDKGASEEMSRKLQRLANLKAAGEAPDMTLSEWIDNLSKDTLKKLAAWGLITAQRLERARPITKHIEAFGKALRAKGDAEVHATKSVAQCKAIVEGCGFQNLPDIDAEKVADFLDVKRKGGMGKATSNHYLTALKGFCKWLVKAKRATTNPVAWLSKLNPAGDRRHERIASTAEEIGKLLEAARKAKKHHGLTGPERAMLYRLAMETGLRVSEIRSLEVKSFSLEGSHLTVTVQAGYSKRRREDVQPLRESMAEAMGPFLKGKLPNTPAFPRDCKWHERAAEMLRKDLEAAGLSYRDEDGKYRDFHSLRHSFVTHLGRSGAHPSTMQALARHSTPVLTMNVYTHILREDEVQAVEGLPEFKAPAAQEGVKSEAG